MAKLIGTAPNQVPTNADLGSMAYVNKESFGGTLTDIDLSEITQKIGLVHNYVYVYDTSKDSDGGAWRHRTKHLSWYNETLNTSTRGSRREFPAVSIIALSDSGDTMTIYDADDPSLPMWMVFEAGGSQDASNLINGGGLNVAARNGVIVYSTFATVINFLTDRGRAYRDSSGSLYWNGFYAGNIAERNALAGWDEEYGSPLLVNGDVNAVNVTVRDNAPIDPVTGLPQVFIAVATDAGISYIQEGGDTIYDTTFTNFNNCGSARFVQGGLLTSNDNGSTSQRFQRVLNIVDYDNDAGSAYLGGASNATKIRMTGDRVLYGANFSYSYGNVNLTSSHKLITDNYPAIGHSGGVAQWVGDQNEFMFANTTHEFATGYQVGDCRLVTLSDTSHVDITGTELVTNGTFDSDVSGWTNAASSYTTITHSSGTMQVSASGGNARVNQGPITLVVGKTYTFSVEVTAETDDNYSFVHLGTSSGGVEYTANLTQDVGVGISSFTFTATSTSFYIQLGCLNGGTVNYDNVSLRLAEEDRSVRHDNLQIFGTVEKTVVADGADLVGYSGFNATTYLWHPINQLDIDWSTEWTLMFWSLDNGFCVSLEDQNTSSYNNTVLLLFNDTSNFVTRSHNANYNVALSDGVFGIHHIAAVYNNGRLQVYKNGEEIYSNKSNGISNLDVGLMIGARTYNGSLPYAPANQKLALLRVSATAATPEQMAKIYQEERPLFNENAKATLYGGSSFVYATAYDDRTNLLHVGTSEGRSVFQGLRRVDNTTEGVTQSISASNGLVADE